ncbi:MAG TPA: hypothetical protein VNW99_09730 [Cytophagaceae bacterium]|nr:hypothetical protein [Cytophagaceae bacterium]
MAVTRLKRKEKRNKIVAKKRVANIKALTKVPVIRKVDIEELRKLASPGLATKVKDAVKTVVDKVTDKE